MSDGFKLVTPEFHSFVENANEQELNDKLVELSKNEHQVFKTRDEDLELQDTKDKAKELSAPYSHALKELKQKRSLVVTTLESRGKV